MRMLKYLVVNSFAEKPFGGNPAGVFLDSEGLTTDEMQRITSSI